MFNRTKTNNTAGVNIREVSNVTVAASYNRRQTPVSKSRL